ncbi:helicase associated domain-containing protein [Arthrobacter sp. CJ23]|uniref:helicase associated domain-containing protein n=1 Tax=Arthrobacter sp. CJ23 TaxID=2972479 RepID=UPI0037C11909
MLILTRPTGRPLRVLPPGRSTIHCPGKMTEQRFESREEWELMYRRGLTQTQIADLCSVPKQDVNRAIGWSKRRDVSVEQEHLVSRPTPTQEDTGLTPLWLGRRDELADFMSREGRTPSSASAEAAERAIARWVSAQRTAARRGMLMAAQRKSLDAIGRWQEFSIVFRNAAAWDLRVQHLVAYWSEQQRWPSCKTYVNEAERSLGIWLHVQRQRVSQGTLADTRRMSLDEATPGWNTWRSRR